MKAAERTKKNTVVRMAAVVVTAVVVFMVVAVAAVAAVVVVVAVVVTLRTVALTIQAKRATTQCASMYLVHVPMLVGTSVGLG